MSWVKLDDRFCDHPKVKPLSDSAFRSVVRAKCYACTYLTDGVLPKAFLETVPVKVRKEILDARLWDESDGVVRVHDFHDYQEDADTVTKRRQDARDRMKKRRAEQERKRKEEAAAGPSSQDVPANSSQCSQDVREGASRPVREPRPDPTRPDPFLRNVVPDPGPSEAALWASVVDYLRRRKDFPERTLREWFEPCEILRRTSALVEIRAPRTIIADYLSKHYRASLTEAFAELTPGARWTVVVKPLAVRPV